ncbi:hypothetical protein KKC83_02410 [Patescibacteria group bacterium]|nr:hypothetical protein [Candidatus Falkowbacteria bacterium]MBU3905993.1 hypothetical protein [Patescibacteria group bacterium]MCG2697554.1 hypothetical protein [Candidatus Parcubacteria bacterium]MBU4014780.1 hypothetical protein [Patescibacteria group bacterium]MBU4026369.1 hypothetical protein [Patescibacteria group bacterium]
MTTHKKILFLTTVFFIISIVFIANFLIIAESAGAADAPELGGLKDTAGNIGYNTAQVAEEASIYIGEIISATLAFIGVIFMVLIWMGAFDLIGAGDNEEIVAKGKSKIKNGVIGIAIIFASYLFVKVVLSIASGGDLNVFKI